MIAELYIKIYRLISSITNRIEFLNTSKKAWVFSQQIENLFFKKKSTDTGYFLVGNGLKIFIRHNTSDEAVFQQVFIRKEYDGVVNLLKINKIEVNNIIDAGANIGMASLVFSSAFPKAEIISIEPDIDNFESLVLNTIDHNIEPINKAVWNCLTQLEITRNFRDGQAWSIQTKEIINTVSSKTNLINTTTFPLIMKYKNWNCIDLLKIDIEGAEQYIFSDEFDMSYLSCTKCIAIEIHDEFNCRDKIQKILLKHGFVLFEMGELTIGVNQLL